jgi:hypothetical protein
MLKNTPFHASLFENRAKDILVLNCLNDDLWKLKLAYINWFQ